MPGKECLDGADPKIKIKLYGPLRSQTGKSYIEVEAQNVLDIFVFIDRNYGTNISQRLASWGTNIDASMQIVINGEIVRELDAKIQPDDDIKIIPMIGGGKYAMVEKSDLLKFWHDYSK